MSPRSLFSILAGKFPKSGKIGPGSEERDNAIREKRRSPLLKFLEKQNVHVRANCDFFEAITKPKIYEVGEAWFNVQNEKGVFSQQFVTNKIHGL